jgi:hypothetical protein
MLGDCRKSPKMAILAISRAIKSITYKRQIYRFRVFRQSLEIFAVLKVHFHYRFIAVQSDLSGLLYIAVSHHLPSLRFWSLIKHIPKNNPSLKIIPGIFKNRQDLKYVLTFFDTMWYSLLPDGHIFSIWAEAHLHLKAIIKPLIDIYRPCPWRAFLDQHWLYQSDTSVPNLYNK